MATGGSARRIARRVGLVAVMLAVPAVLGVGGLWLYATGGRFVTSENAYVKAGLIVVSPEVAGHVTEVAVRDNQRVAAGDLLFRIDAQRYEVAKAQAEAGLAAARQRVAALKARYRTRAAELAAASSDAAFMRDELERTARLRAGGTIAETRLLADQRLAAAAENRISVAREEIAEVLAELAGDPDLAVDRHPDVQRAQAELGRAGIDLAATAVHAPSDAITANVKLQPGEYVEAGEAVMSLVSAAGYWVEANLKETELTHLTVGQSVEMTIDAYPDVVWTGSVASLAPATGAEYALLPPQNASGNWVKVVQRVPVRVEIDPQDGAPPLRAGMSVAVSIDTGHQREMPALVSAARAWILPEATAADGPATAATAATGPGATR